MSPHAAIGTNFVRCKLHCLLSFKTLTMCRKKKPNTPAKIPRNSSTKNKADSFAWTDNEVKLQSKVAFWVLSWKHRCEMSTGNRLTLERSPSRNDIRCLSAILIFLWEERKPGKTGHNLWQHRIRKPPFSFEHTQRMSRRFKRKPPFWGLFSKHFLFLVPESTA